MKISTVKCVLRVYTLDIIWWECHLPLSSSSSKFINPVKCWKINKKKVSKQIPREEHSIKCLTSTPQSCLSHQKWGKFGKLSKPREASCGTWMGSQDRKRTLGYKLRKSVWIYLWAFYFVPLIYISVFVPVPYCLDDCGFVVEPEVRPVDSSSSILLSQDCFGWSRFFCISIQILKLFVLVLWKIPLVAW